MFFFLISIFYALLQSIAKFDFVNFSLELCQVVLRRQSFESELSRYHRNNLQEKSKAFSCSIAKKSHKKMKAFSP